MTNERHTSLYYCFSNGKYSDIVNGITQEVKKQIRPVCIKETQPRQFKLEMDDMVADANKMPSKEKIGNEIQKLPKREALSIMR